MAVTRGPRAAAVLLAALVVAWLTSACSPSAAAPRPADGGPGRSAAGSAAGSAAAGRSESPGDRSSGCDGTIGSQLRERTTTGAAGVTLLAGTLACGPVGIWTASWTLDGDPASDPAPAFVGTYTGAQDLRVPISTAAGRCGATAVIFSPAATTASSARQAVDASQQARGDVAEWPATASPTVPGATVLRGRTSLVLAGSTGGDPATCSPGQSVASPVAAVGDCWLAVSSANGSGGTRFRSISCDAEHTHEVYSIAGVSASDYEANGKPQGLSASAWARKQAADVCNDRRDEISLTSDVSPAEIHLEYLWPSMLVYPPPTSTGWETAQIVCLARWKDGKPSDRHLLHR